jgi:hypothetical protein
MGQLEFTVSCDECDGELRSTVSGWQQNCQAAIDSAQAAGWNLGDTDCYMDLCSKCAAEWNARQPGVQP